MQLFGKTQLVSVYSSNIFLKLTNNVKFVFLYGGEVINFPINSLKPAIDDLTQIKS